MAESIDLEKAAAEALAASGSGDADHLLDRILRNALGEGAVAPQPSATVKKEVKQEVKIKAEIGENVKAEGVKNEGVKNEGVKNEGVKNETLKSEALVKHEGLKSEALVKHEGIKTEGGVKGEPGIKREPNDALAEKRGRSRGKKKRSRSRGKRSRSRKRRRSRSRRRRRRSSSSSRSASKSPVAAAIEGLPQARVVAVRGHWAQYLSPAGETFYKNVLSGEVQWQKPGNFDCQPSRRAGEMTPAPGEAACYIFHMPPEWSEADLMQLFAPFGQVTAAHVQRDANGFSRSCGFVTYAAAEHANQACQMMNGFGVDGKFLKVSLTQFSLGTTAPRP